MDAPDPVMVRLRKALAYAKTYGLTRDDRLGLAEIILRRDVTSWKQLDRAELDRLLDALEGYALIAHLRSGQTEA
jgi:hypothetical protein